MDIRNPKLTFMIDSSKTLGKKSNSRIVKQVKLNEDITFKMKMDSFFPVNHSTISLINHFKRTT
jgi:hypothetical protein